MSRLQITYAAAKAPGQGHELRGVPCQDAVYVYRGGEAVCAALSDGAGSYERSELVSEAVSGQICRDVAEHFSEWYDLTEDAFQEAMIEKCRLFAQKDDPVLRAQCTLLVYAAANDGRILWCHIGDGMIIGVSESDEVQVISAPENGAEPNQTFFLSGSHATDHLRVSRECDPEIDTVILCSDGAGISLYDFLADAPAPAVTIMAQWMRHHPTSDISEALQHNLETVFRQNTADDVSIIMLHMNPA